MVFSSIVFLLYFLPVFLITYYLVTEKYKNWVLLLFSVFFYSWGAPKFIFVIIGTTYFDFQIVKYLSNSENQTRKNVLLFFSVFLNLGLLFYFKYSNFFVENINSFLSVLGVQQIKWVELILPIGISFYTFETITYVVDVYRKVHKPLVNFWDYLLYIILFPKLIAGPIVRYHELADQISNRSQNDTIDNRLMGFYRFSIGLGKKILIANQLGVQADYIFSLNYSDLSTLTAWVGVFAYTFQIYFDFSGYSDMAIGIAKMIGFKFPENFNNPYTSKSITEFWRRWHISLGNWMRNYLYIPLGGNRVKNKRRLYFNLWLVFVLSGFWHGASWCFVIWGIYHGFFLILERIFLKKILDKVGGVFSTFFTFLLVSIGWVFFRVEKVEYAFVYIKRLFSFDNFKIETFESEFYIFFYLAVLFSFFTCFTIGQKIQDKIYFNKYSDRLHLMISICSVVVFILSITSITSFGFNPFIYFRF
jgi:alginate O-acetyltransferase complex protein AlgI